jgi:hypothetical protein
MMSGVQKARKPEHRQTARRSLPRAQARGRLGVKRIASGKLWRPRLFCRPSGSATVNNS